jgi:hypothetical protein
MPGLEPRGAAMRRREFISLVGGAAAWPLTARAQQGERMRRIGVLIPLAENHPEAQPRAMAFQRALQELGWMEGRNVHIDYRFAASAERIAAHATELVALAPDVIDIKLTGGRCYVLCHRRPNVRCLLSSRRHVEAKTAGGTAAMRELPRTNLGRERVACRTG